MQVTIKTTDGPVAKLLKQKFNDCGGEAYIPMLKGEDKLFWATNEGLYNNGFKGYLCRWEEFDALINKLQELGGLMYRFDSAAQSGKKLGSDDLPLDSMEGFIAVNFHNDAIGRTITRRSTYYAVVLDWAEIVHNRRAHNGKPGYICIR